VNIHDVEQAPGDALNQPAAEIRSLRKKPVSKPRIGVAKGKFKVPDSFFDPLPDEILKAFTGKT
jgi:hypothetical protein